MDKQVRVIESPAEMSDFVIFWLRMTCNNLSKDVV